MSCLFNSLHFFIPCLTPRQIRNSICDYLEQNEPIIDGIDTAVLLSLDGSSDQYISSMRSTSTWGGAIEIQAACNIWRTVIIVQNRRGSDNDDIEFLPVKGIAQSSIVVKWTGGHYEPISDSFKGDGKPCSMSK
jgi:hypothetical protein